MNAASNIPVPPSGNGGAGFSELFLGLIDGLQEHGFCPGSWLQIKRFSGVIGQELLDALFRFRTHPEVERNPTGLLGRCHNVQGRPGLARRATDVIALTGHGR